MKSSTMNCPNTFDQDHSLSNKHIPDISMQRNVSVQGKRDKQNTRKGEREIEGRAGMLFSSQP